MMKRLYRYFSEPYRLSALNAVLVLAIVIANIYWQVFCIPVLWAAIVLLVCFANTIFYPILYRRRRLLPLVSFVNGVCFMIYIYCILFLWQMNLLGLLLVFVVIGFVTYVPHFFVLQLLYKNIIKPPVWHCRLFFVAGILLCIGGAFYAGTKVDEGFDAINRSARGGYVQLEHSYMTERLLGIGFLYHLSFCEYDGWRPPLHDPALVVGLLFCSAKEYPDIDFDERFRLYKKFYPDRPYKLDCSCASMYSEDYHRDELWK